MFTKPGNADKFFWTDQAVRARDRSFRSRANAIASVGQGKDAKLLLSTDPGLLKLLREAAVLLSNEFPPIIDKNGFATGYAVTRDFSQLLTVSGFLMDPLTIPPVSNESLLTELKLEKSGFQKEEHRRIFDALFKCMFGTYVPAGYSVSVQSSTSMPYFQKNKVFKIRLCEWILDNLETILSLVDELDLQGLHELGIIIAYYLNLRAQPDGAKDILNGDLSPKDRFIYDRSGVRRKADKTSELEAKGIFGHYAARARTVFATPGAVSYLLSMFIAGRRAHYFKEYEFTWHHVSPDQLYGDLEATAVARIAGVDVTQMDQSVPAWFLETYADSWSQFWDPRLVKLLKLLNKAPYYTPGENAQSTGFWAADPLSKDAFRYDVGLASGRPDNPDIGKLWMTFTFMSGLHDQGFNVIDPNRPENDQTAVDAFLRGRHPEVILKDMSDDCIFGFTKAGLKKAEGVIDSLKAGTFSSYAKVDFEKGVAFLGNVFVADSTGAMKVPEPNAVTYLVNMLVPERGVTDGMRKYWGHGILERREHYSQAGSVINEIDDIVFSHLWSKHLPNWPTMRQMARLHADANPLPFINTLSYADLEVLSDPSKRFYKYSDDDLSAEVLQLFSAAVPPEMIVPKIEPFHNT